MFRRMNRAGGGQCLSSLALLAMPTASAAQRSYRPVDQSGNTFGRGGGPGFGGPSGYPSHPSAAGRGGFGGGSYQSQQHQQQQYGSVPSAAAATPNRAAASDDFADFASSGGWMDVGAAEAPSAFSTSGFPAASSSPPASSPPPQQQQQSHQGFNPSHVGSNQPSRGGFGGGHPQHHHQQGFGRGGGFGGDRGRGGGGANYGRGGAPSSHFQQQHQQPPQQQQQSFGRPAFPPQQQHHQGSFGSPQQQQQPTSQQQQRQQSFGRPAFPLQQQQQHQQQQQQQMMQQGAPSQAPQQQQSRHFMPQQSGQQQQQAPREAEEGNEDEDCEGGEEEDDEGIVVQTEAPPELKISILDPNNRNVSVQPLKQFDHLFEDIPRWLAEGIRRTGYSSPMPVQASSIPLLMEGRDVIAVAPTGSGKTVAFAIPALANLDPKNTVRGRNRASPSVVVLCPTRELVTQTHKVLMSLCSHGGPHIQAVYGGTDREAQAKIIRRGCEVIVATPGRLCDFLEDDVVSLEQLDFLVLDEADRMLEMGFAPTLTMITSCLNKSRPRVTMMWSATWSDTVSGLAKNFLNPNRLMINCEGDGNTANKNIAQYVYSVQDDSDKLAKIVSLYSNGTISMDQKTIIFAKRKDDIPELTTQFARALGFAPNHVSGLHGSLKQTKRAGIIKAFREGHIRVLIATDIAGRGLDVPSIDHVINYDLPLHIDAYVHRIGRTGRAGRKGSAHTIISMRNTSAIVAELGEYYAKNEIETPNTLASVFNHATNRNQTRRSRYKDHKTVQGEFWRTRGHDPNTPKPSFNRGGGGGGSGFFTKTDAPRSVLRS